LSPPRPN